MSANKVILNGETILDLTQTTASEKDVALGKMFYKKDGSLSVGEYKAPSISTGEGVAVNGKIVQQIVADGKSVNKGDFVEIAGGGTGADLDSLGIVGSSHIYMLDENTIVFMGYPTISVIEFVGASWHLLYTTDLSLSGDNMASCCRMSDNIFIIFMGTRDEGTVVNDANLYANVLEITKDGVTVKNKDFLIVSRTFVYNYSHSGCDSVVLDKNHFVVLSCLTGGDNIKSYNQLFAYELSDEHQLIKKHTLSNISDGITYSIRKLNDTTILTYTEADSSSYSLVAYGVDNWFLSQMASTNDYRIYNWTCFNDEVVLVDRSSLSTTLVLKLENGVFVKSKQIDANVVPGVILSESLYCVISGGYIKLYNSQYENVSELQSPATATYSTVVSSNSFYCYFVGSNSLANYQITNDNAIILNENAGSKVQPANGTLYLYGVALESGSSGDTISVAVPEIA